MNIKKDNLIVVVGSSNTDMVVKTNHLPQPGETVLGGQFNMFSGGKGANQAVAAARLGGNVTFIAKTGKDLFGKQALEAYKSENINTQYIITDEKSPSGVALISVDKKGENCISVASGANAELKPDDICKIKDVIESAAIVLMQLEIPLETVVYTAKTAKNKGVKVILNPAPAVDLPDDLLKCLYAITPNEIEAERISGIKITDIETAGQAAKAISKNGIEIVIITLGSKGLLVKNGDEYYKIPANKVDVVDTTAAGDTFCGAFCVALSEGYTVEKAASIANKAASIAVSRQGAQNSILYRDEVF
jgi:ribokinase